MNITEFRAIERASKSMPYAERYKLLKGIEKQVDRDENNRPCEFSLGMVDPGEVQEQSAITQDMVERELSKALAKYNVARNPNPLGYIGEHASPVKRYGHLSYFKGANADERAHRFGMWALAAMGSPTAKSFCASNGLTHAIGKTVGHYEDDNTLGGMLVPEEFEADIINLKNEYGVFRVEARLRSMTSDFSRRPRRVGGLTANFVGEGQAGAASNMTWDSVSLSAKKLMVLTKLSKELDEDAAASVGDELMGEIVYAFVYKEDLCGFTGDASSTYGGITGVCPKLITINGVDDGGGIVLGAGNAWSELVLSDFHRTVARCPTFARANAKWYASPTFIDSVMMALQTAAGGNTVANIAEGGQMKFLGYPVVPTEAMPTAEANSQVCALFGNLKLSSTFGERRQTTIEFSSSGEVDGVDVFQTDEIAVKGTERIDINNHDLGNSTTAGPVVGLITRSS